MTTQTVDPPRIVERFFDSDTNMYLDLDKCTRLYGSDTTRRVFELIEEDLRGPRRGTAIISSGCIGDDGAGYESFSRELERAETEGKPWIHFDSELACWGISKTIPGYTGPVIDALTGEARG